MSPGGKRRPLDAKPGRYEELLEKAAQVFAQNGFAEATIQQIAAEMGMSAPALYYYVRSKDELHYEIWRRAGARLQAGLDEVVSLDLPPEQKLQQAFHRHLQIITANKPVFEVLILQRSRLPEYNRENLVDDERRYLHTFAGLVAEWLGPDDGADSSSVLALGAMAMLNGVLRWYSPAESLSLEQIADLYFGLFTNGAATASRRVGGPRRRSRSAAGGAGR
jgi:TetR/AcrR family transcriptional regulator, cholesterol catabolism regulator